MSPPALHLPSVPTHSPRSGSISVSQFQYSRLSCSRNAIFLTRGKSTDHLMHCNATKQLSHPNVVIVRYLILSPLHYAMRFLFFLKGIFIIIFNIIILLPLPFETLWCDMFFFVIYLISDSNDSSHFPPPPLPSIPRVQCPGLGHHRRPQPGWWL